MAKNNKGSKLKGNKPRLTDEKGKPLPPAKMAEHIDAWVDTSFDEELRLTAYLDVNTRRQTRLATGVGDMNSFVEEFNKGLVNVMTVSTPATDKLKSEIQADQQKRPRLKKINQEYQIVYRPPKKN